MRKLDAKTMMYNDCSKAAKVDRTNARKLQILN